MNFRSLLKIAFVGTGNALNAGLGMLFLIAVARTLDLESFGKYALITSNLVFLSRLLDFGTNYNYVAQAITDKTTSFSDFIYAKLLLFVVAVPIAALILQKLGFSIAETLPIFVVGLTLYGINFTFHAIFQQKEAYTKLVALNTIPAFIKGMFAMLILVKILPITYQTAAAIFALSLAGSLVLVAGEIKAIVKSQTLRHANMPRALELIKKSVNAGISQLIYEGWPAINNTLAKLTQDFSGAGIFSVANKISTVFSVISLSIFTVLLPKNAKHKVKGLDYDYKELAVIIIGVIAVAVGSIGAAQILISIGFGNMYKASLALIDILIVSAALNAIQSFLEHIFYIEKRTAILLKINLTKLGTLLTIFLLVFRSSGLVGIAYSTLTASFVGTALTLYFSLKRSPM